MMHTSATVPPYGPAGTSRAFPQRIAGTLVGQEHFQTPVHWPTPLWSFAKFRGRPSFATPLIGFGAHGARPHIHPAVTVGGPYWHSVCDGFHVFLVLGQYFRIVVIMRLRILATIAIDPLFEKISNYCGHQQLHQPAKPHRHKQPGPLWFTPWKRRYHPGRRCGHGVRPRPAKEQTVLERVSATSFQKGKHPAASTAAFRRLSRSDVSSLNSINLQQGGILHEPMTDWEFEVTSITERNIMKAVDVLECTHQVRQEKSTKGVD